MKKISKNIILMITVLNLIGLYGIPTKIPNEIPGDYNEMQTIIESKPLIPNSAESHLPIMQGGADRITYSTFLGAGDIDYGCAIAVDDAGCVYITGYTYSTGFPTTVNAVNETHYGSLCDAFVCKMSADGSTLLYSTLLVGSGKDYGRGIDVDEFGNAYVIGTTESPDFPTTSGAYGGTFNGGDSDIFVCKINEDGTQLLYSTFLGSYADDGGSDIVADSSGCAYAAGYVNGMSLSVGDGLIWKLNADGSGLLFSKIIGGNDDRDRCSRIALDPSGCIYVAGWTQSSDFPTTTGSYGESFNGGITDIFVCKLYANGSNFEYSTLIGGNKSDTPEDIALDPTGACYIIGQTLSGDFPITIGTPEPNRFYEDIVICKISADGKDLDFSTCFGSGPIDYGRGIALDSSGDIYYSGYTTSSEFPVTSGAMTDEGSVDIIVGKLGPNGAETFYSSYLGGEGEDCYGYLALDSTGSVYITGRTQSSSFPTTVGVWSETFCGGYDDVFITKMDLSALPKPTFITTSHTLLSYNCSINWNNIPGATYDIYIDEVVNLTTSNNYQEIVFQKNGTYIIEVKANVDGLYSEMSDPISIVITVSPEIPPDDSDPQDQKPTVGTLSTLYWTILLSLGTVAFIARKRVKSSWRTP